MSGGAGRSGSATPSHHISTNRLGTPQRHRSPAPIPHDSGRVGLRVPRQDHDQDQPAKSRSRSRSRHRSPPHLRAERVRASHSPSRRTGPDGTPFGALPKKKGGLAAHVLNTYRHIKAEQEAGHRSKGVLEKALDGWMGKGSDSKGAVLKKKGLMNRENVGREGRRHDEDRGRFDDQGVHAGTRQHRDSGDVTRDRRGRDRHNSQTRGETQRDVEQTSGERGGHIATPDIQITGPMPVHPHRQDSEAAMERKPPSLNPYLRSRSPSIGAPADARELALPSTPPQFPQPPSPVPRPPSTSSVRRESDVPEEHSVRQTGEAASYYHQAGADAEQSKMPEIAPPPGRQEPTIPPFPTFGSSTDSAVSLSSTTAVESLPASSPPPPPPGLPPATAEATSRPQLGNLLKEIHGGRKLRKVDTTENATRSTAASPVHFADHLHAAVRRKPAYEGSAHSHEADDEDAWSDDEPRSHFVPDRRFREALGKSLSRPVSVSQGGTEAGMRSSNVASQNQSESLMGESRTPVVDADEVDNEIFSTLSARVGSPSWDWRRLGKDGEA
jgi:hypothetical protein